MDTLKISEAIGGMFNILLPTCDASVLSKILDPGVPVVSLIGFGSKDGREWIEQHLPSPFKENVRDLDVHIKRLEMDISLPTSDFLRILPDLVGQGLDLVQGTRPIPRNLVLSELKPEAKAHIFREIGLVLQFYLPHPHEHALVSSPSKAVLERIVDRIRT